MIATYFIFIKQQMNAVKNANFIILKLHASFDVKYMF